MNLNMKTLNPPSERTGSSFTTACLASCQKLVQRIEAAREAIVAEYHEAVGDHHRVLRLALREAEALAWDTELPHLIFPTLATRRDSRKRSPIAAYRVLTLDGFGPITSW